jgi:hypothetical protein
MKGGFEIGGSYVTGKPSKEGSLEVVAERPQALPGGFRDRLAKVVGA